MDEHTRGFTNELFWGNILHKKYGQACSLSLRILLGVIYSAWFGFLVVYFIAGLAFAIQAIVVIDQKNEDCGDDDVYSWLTAYAVLTLAFWTSFLTWLSLNSKTKGCIKGLGIVLFLLGLSIFGALCYGYDLLRHHDFTEKHCSNKRWERFEFMVNFMFFGIVALLGAVLLMIFILLDVYLTWRSETMDDSRRQTLMGRDYEQQSSQHQLRQQSRSGGGGPSSERGEEH